MIGSASHFLVRCKTDADLSVRHIILHQTLCHTHDRCHTSLVIRSEDRGSVAGDQRTAFQGRQMREEAHFKRTSALTQRQILTVIVFMDDRLYHMICKIGHGIHMGNEAQDFAVLIARCRGNARINIAFVIDSGVFYAHLLQLVYQNVGQVELALGGGNCCGIFVAGRGNHGIFNQTFVSSHFYILLYFKAFPPLLITTIRPFFFSGNEFSSQ